jgi:hypothetical protein
MSKNPSPKEGTSIAGSNPDTTKYHEDEAKMICNVMVQHTQEWWGAIMIHDEHECDKYYHPKST